MRRLLLSLLLAPCVALAQGPTVRPAAPQPGWDLPVDQFFASFAAADARNGNRAGLLDTGCAGTAWLVCDLDLRSVPVKVRAALPDRRITEVELALGGRASRANAAAAVHTLARWAEPGAADDDRRRAVGALLEASGSRAEATLGRTRLTATEGFSGWRVVAAPIR